MPRPSDPNARNRLLEAAARVFVEHGLDRAKVEDITRAAGLSKGAFYLHFKTKDDAFKEILGSALAELGEILGDMEGSRDVWSSKPHAEMIEHWLAKDHRLFECLWKHRAIMRLVLEGGGSPNYQHLIDLFAQGAQETSERLIHLGVEHGYYRSDLEPKQAAAFIAGGYDRLARRLVHERRKPNLERWLLGAQALCIRAIGTPELIQASVNVHSARLSDSSRRRASA
jgi:AcrR family transcriptional regulator